MLANLLLILFIAINVASSVLSYDNYYRQPYYQRYNKYATEVDTDYMDTAPSSSIAGGLPYHRGGGGYHVVEEGGYYNPEFQGNGYGSNRYTSLGGGEGYGGRYGGYGGRYGGMGGEYGGYGSGGFRYQPQYYGSSPYYNRAYYNNHYEPSNLGRHSSLGIDGYHHAGRSDGGELVDKSVYSNANKALNDESYKKASGKEGVAVNHDKEGYEKDATGIKNVKGDSSYYHDNVSGKNLAENGGSYYGAKQYDQAGKQSVQANEQKGHKKGHVIKGFKTSHHKDETGKTEEYFDEENDEGGKLNYHGQQGNFGEKSAENVKGERDFGEQAARGHQKEGHYNNEHFVDNRNADQGKYGERKYHDSGSIYGYNNGAGEQSVLGRNEKDVFYKHHNVPFYY